MVQPYTVQRHVYLIIAFSFFLAVSAFLSILFPFLVVALSALLLHLYERLWGDSIDFVAYGIALGFFAGWYLVRW